MIQISEAILHVFDAIGVQEVLSAHPLNPHNVVMTEYISHHIERGLADAAACARICAGRRKSRGFFAVAGWAFLQ